MFRSWTTPLVLRRGWPALWWALGLVACTTHESDESSATDTGAVVPAESCAERCSAKGRSCMAPAEIAAAKCADVCAEGPTDEELRCLENLGCTALEHALFDHSGECGLGGGDEQADVGEDPSAEDDGDGDDGDGDDSQDDGPADGDDDSAPEDDGSDDAPSCVPLGDSGCAATGPSCCDDNLCDEGVCCVPFGGACVEDADCCGGFCVPDGRGGEHCDVT